MSPRVVEKETERQVRVLLEDVMDSDEGGDGSEQALDTRRGGLTNLTPNKPVNAVINYSVYPLVCPETQ